MGDQRSQGTGHWARYATVDAAGEPARALSVVRDGGSWRLGTAADVEWITSGTRVDRTIVSAVPPLFDAYATIVLPHGGEGQERHDEALLSVLREHSSGSSWWLGYLDTGADNVVFPDAPRVQLYAGWSYVLVQAGPEQAARWRSRRHGSFWRGRLPNLIFPTDRFWLVSTLWDDDWTCIGGTSALVAGLMAHPELGSRTRPVTPAEDATPPGHQAI